MRDPDGLRVKIHGETSPGLSAFAISSVEDDVQWVPDSSMKWSRSLSLIRFAFSTLARTNMCRSSSLLTPFGCSSPTQEPGLATHLWLRCSVPMLFSQRRDRTLLRLHQVFHCGHPGLHRQHILFRSHGVPSAVSSSRRTVARQSTNRTNDERQLMFFALWANTCAKRFQMQQ